MEGVVHVRLDHTIPTDYWRMEAVEAPIWNSRIRDGGGIPQQFATQTSSRVWRTSFSSKDGALSLRGLVEKVLEVIPNRLKGRVSSS